MWIFLPFGFFSVVAHRERKSNVLVRARAKADLDRFCEHLATAQAATFQHTPDADYPYRIEISRRALSEMLMWFTEEELTYDNFKNEVARVAGLERAYPLHDVWETMQCIEDEGARRTAKAPTKGARGLRRSV